MANIGTTIAPWMVFFQQSSVVDKRMQEKDVPLERADTAFGALFTVVVAVFCIIVSGTLLRGANVESAAQAATQLKGVNDYVGTFLAIGLFDAGLLGAVCISLASSWAFGEVFGWAHSLNNKVREAPWFYLSYFFALITAAAVVLIPKAPLILITLFVQVIAVTLLPAALTFLILLLNNEELMGKYKNTRVQNVLGFTIIIAIVILSTMYSVSVLFPGLFK
jgi:Mn2+/Fe2+ NRAMP family transporter